ncbi:MAG: winged helix-turn-helix transcriptional regulator [Thermodesulfobacteriota bacterium]
MRWQKGYTEEQKKRILKIFAKSNPDITKSDVIKATGWDRKTIDRYFKEMLKDGVIVQNRPPYGKYIFYRLKKRKNLKFKLYKLKK